MIKTIEAKTQTPTTYPASIPVSKPKSPLELKIESRDTHTPPILAYLASSTLAPYQIPTTFPRLGTVASSRPRASSHSEQSTPTTVHQPPSTNQPPNRTEPNRHGTGNESHRFSPFLLGVNFILAENTFSACISFPETRLGKEKTE